jgi:para-nitrobenzyl esterase
MSLPCGGFWFKQLFFLAVAVVASVVVGCGGGGGGGSNGDNTSPAESTEPIVTLSLGTIQGQDIAFPVTNDAVQVFSRIPYAAAPVGDLRWRPPQPPVAWNGTLDATQTVPTCPQYGSGEEDCLFLNIYRPFGTTASSKLPVVVYAYGGANTGGSLNGVNGSRMASLNNIIAVTINYRIGALGFMKLPALEAANGGELSGNYGVQDMIAALNWVKNYIAPFGGDPTKVTLASQSSGSTNTCRLLVEPAASGLFRAAVLSSEDCIHDVDSIPVAEARGIAAATALGCTTGTPADIVACMRGKTASQISLQGGFTWNPWTASGVGAGWALNEIEAGNYPNKVPMLVGSTREEGRSAGASYISGTWTLARYQTWVETLATSTTTVNSTGAPQAMNPAQIQLILNRYDPPTRYPSEAIPGRGVGYTVGDVITDAGLRGLGGCTNLRLAQAFAPQVPTFFYQFENDSTSAACAYNNLASHGSDVAYLWPGPTQTFTPAQQALSEQMIRYWGNFVKNLDPNGADLPAWYQMSPGLSGYKQSLRPNGASVATPVNGFYIEHNCDIWLDPAMPTIIDRG